MSQKIGISLIDKDGKVQVENTNDGFVYLAYHHGYRMGDRYQISVEKTPVYLMVRLEPSLAPALIYVTKNTWEYEIPFDVQREWPYPANAFNGQYHYAEVRLATADEISGRRNLAVNSHDQRNESGAYPHVSANAETRSEMVFFAKNAIDGIVANESHGSFPFQSWGIDQRDDAELYLDFGRDITADELVIVLRADYPHDSHWVQMDVEFSDGTTLQLKPQKTKEKQSFKFDSRKIHSLKLTHLVKDKDASTFPALTQIEVYGQDIN